MLNARELTPPLLVHHPFPTLPQRPRGAPPSLPDVPVSVCVLTVLRNTPMQILTLYAQRPIVDKQARYAFYRPSAEAFASMLTDMPYKICNAILFNLMCVA